MNDLNALNRMLTVKFELRINWYTNKGQISSTANERNDMSLRSVAKRDSSSNFKNLFLITSKHPSGIVLCYKTKFSYTGLQSNDTMPMILLSCASKV